MRYCIDDSFQQFLSVGTMERYPGELEFTENGVLMQIVGFYF